MAAGFLKNRLGLFLPFIVLGLLFAGYFGLWWQTQSKILSGLGAAGFAWRDVHVTGFPTRLAMRFNGLSYKSDVGVWRMQDMHLHALPYDPSHVIMAFHTPHIIDRADGQIRIDHAGNQASLRLEALGKDFGKLARAVFEFTRPDITVRHADQTIYIGAERATWQLAPLAGGGQTLNERANVTVQARDMKVNQGVPLARFALSANLNAALLKSTSGRMATALMDHPIDIDRLEIKRQELAVKASGKLRVTPDGYLSGKLNLVLINLIALADLMVEFKIVAATDRARVIDYGEIAAAFSGETIDRITLPLHFRDGQALIGPLPVGAAPKIIP